MLVEHMEQGYSFETFAAKCDCCVDTLYEWVKVNPEFSEAKKRGTIKSLLFFEKLGVWMADPRVNTARSNVTAWIYQMKCRFNKFGWNPVSADPYDAGDDFEFK